MMLTLALTGTASPTEEPELGDVMVTIRLPPGSGGSNCAKTRGAVQARLKIANATTPQARLKMFNMECPSTEL
jgi:hypothetical protein